MVPHACKITVAVDFIFWLVLCSREDVSFYIICLNVLEVRKGAKIRNRYNQAPHLTQDTNGKVTTSRSDITKIAKRSALSQQVTTRHQQTDMPESITKQDRNNIHDLQKKHLLGTVSKLFFGGSAVAQW